MSAREFFALGTASQVPTRNRSHHASFLRWGEHGFLLDPGEGAQRQMLFAGLAASAIDRILITHFHGDHCLGLAGMVQRISLDSVPHKVHIVYPASGRKFVERMRAATAFHDRARLELCPVRHKGIVEQGDFVLTALPLDHGIPTLGYRIQEPDGVRMLPDKLAAAGIDGPDVRRLIADGSLGDVALNDVSEPRAGQAFAFVMDTRLCDNAFELARGVDLLVCEATYLSSEQKEAEERGHLTAAQAATIARDAGARRLVLTHFSQRYYDVAAHREEAQAIFPDVYAVEDGDVVPVPKRR